MLIRRASGAEMLALWGYGPDDAPPTASFFLRSIESGNAVFWALEEGGEIIGELYAFLRIDEDPDFADGETAAYLCAFRIKPGFRGRGLGSALLETALAELREMGFSRATIGVDEGRNERLYRRMGFTREIKTCYFDPCARDASGRPEPDEGYLLLEKEL
ncbi:MAG: GNAT family N-acetyltransferase [Clostridia bacterium]|nr:GNAT family N-acetyltransferase [Clostridia bacterium]